MIHIFKGGGERERERRGEEKGKKTSENEEGRKEVKYSLSFVDQKSCHGIMLILISEEDFVLIV